MLRRLLVLFAFTSMIWASQLFASAKMFGGPKARVWTIDAYDANGNRTESSGVPATYDAQDRLIRRGDTAYTLGPNGELVSKTAGGATTTYAYDTRGNLKSVALPGGKTIDYVVDPTWRRVGKKINGQLVQGFLYDGARPVAELDSGGLLVSFFTYASRAHVPDFIVKDNAPYRLITDERGSVRLVVRAATEEVVQRIDYDAWGNVTSDSNPGFQPFGFAGGFYDSDTGLVRFGARDYDAASGRWTSKDPSGVAMSANVYAYADNDPVNRIDADGHFAILIPVLIGAGEGAISNAFISIVEQSVSNGCIDWGQVGHDALVGGVIGGLSGGLVGLLAGDACAAGVCRGGGLCFAAGTPVVTESGLVPIEQLRVGDRVVADNPECATDHIDANSQTVTVQLDGSAGSVHVEAIRPSTWLEGDGLETRGRAWVDLPELKVSGWGTIIHVGPAPPEKPGDGCLVLTTVNQVADQLLRLRFAETTDELELTPSHRLYVEGRGWVAAQELTKGDTLRAESGGRVTVLAVERVAGQRVYNLEVGREHSYRVLAGGVWAHNACGGGGGAAEGGAARQTFYRLGSSYESAARLGRQAAAAEETEIGVLRLTDLHGVSVSPTVPSVPAGAASRAAIEDVGFDLVHSPTAADPMHHTLILPKPVTREVADIFNALFGRGYR